MISQETQDAREIIAHALHIISSAATVARPVADPGGPLGKCVAYGIEYLYGQDSPQAKDAWENVVQEPRP